jgi:lipoprotein-anchoring transpeptidase ErfK/SrfK
MTYDRNRSIPKAPAVALPTAAQTARTTPTTRHLILLVGLALVTLAAGVGGLYAAFAATRVTTHAPDGVAFGTVDVSGFSAAELGAALSRIEEGARIAVSHEGRTVHARLADLGVAVDQATTIAAALQASPGSVYAGSATWAKETVPLTFTVDQWTMHEWAVAHFPIAGSQPANAQVTYDETSKAFDVTPAHGGYRYDLAPVEAALAELAILPEEAAAATITLVEADPAIGDAAALAAAEAANARLKLDFRFAAGGAAYTATPADIAGWIGLVSDPATGRIDVTYDAATIRASLADLLPPALDQEGAVRRVVHDHSGQQVAVAAAGQPARTVGDLTGTATTVAQVLAQGANANLTVPMVDDEPETLVATLLDGATVVKAFVISSGKNETPTPVGTFHVYAKVAKQTMTGRNADGTAYSIPDVPWATWFYGDYGFHAAYWLDESQIGTPQSHGCINMRVDEAKYVYDWADYQTTVVVHGEAPD